MKNKRIILLGIAVILSICVIVNVIDHKDFKKGYQIRTYIDGKLAASIPSSTEGYVASEINCSNNAVGTFNHSTWELEVTNVTSSTVCDVKFVTNPNTTFNTYLKNKACNTTPTTSAAAKDCLVNENGYRFEGANPNNYVLYNGEIWRIIGVFTVKNSAGTSQDLVKLIRDESIGTIAYDIDGTSGSSDWYGATLQTLLNENYYNKTDGTCHLYTKDISKPCGFDKIGLNSTARNMIESVVWNLGGNNSLQVTITDIYNFERGTEVPSGSQATWTGKIGLIYLSDYGYSVLASEFGRSTSVLNSFIIDDNNWMNGNSAMWTITPFTYDSKSMYYISYDGRVYCSDMFWDLVYEQGFGVRPTLYLKSSVKYVSGDGTYTNPYQIN